MTGQNVCLKSVGLLSQRQQWHQHNINSNASMTPKHLFYFCLSSHMHLYKWLIWGQLAKKVLRFHRFFFFFCHLPSLISFLKWLSGFVKNKDRHENRWRTDNWTEKCLFSASESVVFVESGHLKHQNEIKQICQIVLGNKDYFTKSWIAFTLTFIDLLELGNEYVFI